MSSEVPGSGTESNWSVKPKFEIVIALDGIPLVSTRSSPPIVTVQFTGSNTPVKPVIVAADAAIGSESTKTVCSATFNK